MDNCSNLIDFQWKLQYVYLWPGKTLLVSTNKSICLLLSRGNYNMLIYFQGGTSIILSVSRGNPGIFIEFQWPLPYSYRFPGKLQYFFFRFPTEKNNYSMFISISSEHYNILYRFPKETAIF